MSTMRYLDLSFEGRQQAERNQLDNGKLPHGSYRGSRKYPPCHLSYDKGREFKDKVDAEVAKLLDQEDIQYHGESPSWALLLHREPSYTDESPLIAQNFLAASKYEKSPLPHRHLHQANKSITPGRYNGTAYYRPNRLHQYLTATELKDTSEDNVDVKYGRPTRTTLLRARQRSSSASTNSYEARREFFQRMDDIKSNCAITPSTEYLQLRSLREGESLHSYLTGARYNRANCLDSKSVEHSGVFMPRNNPAYGMFFRGPKGQEYIQEFQNTFPPPLTPPNSARRRPLTAPTAYIRRPPPITVAPTSATNRPSHKATRKSHSRGAGDVLSNRAKEPKLNVVGYRLQVAGMSTQHLSGRLPKRPETAGPAVGRRGPRDETFITSQPPPTPTDPAPKVPELPDPGVASESGDPVSERTVARSGVEVPAGEPDEVSSVVTQRVDTAVTSEGTPKEMDKAADITAEQARSEEKVKETTAVDDSTLSQTVDGEPLEKEVDFENVQNRDEDVQDPAVNSPGAEQTGEDDGGDVQQVPVEETAIEVQDDNEGEKATAEGDDSQERSIQEQAKELVEQVVEKAEEEVEKDVQEQEEDEEIEAVGEENQEEEGTQLDEENEETTEEAEKATKEVRFFITEDGGGPREEQDEGKVQEEQDEGKVQEEQDSVQDEGKVQEEQDEGKVQEEQGSVQDDGS